MLFKTRDNECEKIEGNEMARVADRISNCRSTLGSIFYFLTIEQMDKPVCMTVNIPFLYRFLISGPNPQLFLT